MKTILGLDLGVASIGWALVNEAQNDSEISSIVQLGVRVNPLTVDETSNFEKGKTITTNADRTLKRSMRRNLQRYKFRRKHLLEVLINAGWITNDSILSEQGNETTFETYRLRDKAATEQISLHQLARILLMINKKRGYKSSRKVNNLEEGQLIDGMSIAKLLYEEGLTPGQWVYATLREGKKYIPDFYRSDLQTEFDKIWECQQRFYPDILNDEFKKLLAGRTKTNTSKIFLARNGIYTAENKGTDKRLQAYKWRVDALTKQLTQEELAFVISELNGSIASCSGYLGAISDRSKELFFNKQTVGQYLMAQLSQNPHTSLTNKVFYRQDYLDEFNTIWETQAKYHEGLSPDLKNEIRDIIIFYQRKLKSQKGLISFCEFESKKIDVWVEGCKKTKTTGLRVSSKSSPLFQEFKIWQILNNITLTVKGDHWTQRLLDQEEKEILFEALNISEKLTKKQALDLLFKKNKDLDLNFESIDGNKTQASLFKTYQTIVELSGHGKYEFSKMPASEVRTLVQSVFEALGYNTAILTFHANLQGSAFEQQPLYQLWHLLYSFEGDNSNSGNENLVNKLTTLNGLDKE
ncbi:MAG: type RNA-guided endonuclease Cas9 [Bacteroidota bacterium]